MQLKFPRSIFHGQGVRLHIPKAAGCREHTGFPFETARRGFLDPDNQRMFSGLILLVCGSEWGHPATPAASEHFAQPLPQRCRYSATRNSGWHLFTQRLELGQSFQMLHDDAMHFPELYQTRLHTAYCIRSSSTGAAYEYSFGGRFTIIYVPSISPP